MDPDLQDTLDMLLDVQSTLAIIQLLEKNEETLMALYRAYAARFPLYEAFWNRIAEDEHMHAVWISQLAESVRKNNMQFARGRFSPESLTDFNSYLQHQLEEVKDPGFTPLQAAIFSLQIEDNMIERHFFKVFQSDSEILRLTLNKLEASTEEHYRRVKDFANSLQSIK